MENIFEKLGGRKFVMGVVLIVIGGVVDLKSANGLSVNLLGLMTAIYATFSASNAIVTNKQLSVEQAQAQAAPQTANADSASNSVKELAAQLLPVLNHIGTGMAQLNEQQGKLSESVATQSAALNAIMKKLT